MLCCVLLCCVVLCCVVLCCVVLCHLVVVVLCCVVLCCVLLLLCCALDCSLQPSFTCYCTSLDLFVVNLFFTSSPPDSPLSSCILDFPPLLSLLLFCRGRSSSLSVCVCYTSLSDSIYQSLSLSLSFTLSVSLSLSLLCPCRDDDISADNMPIFSPAARLAAPVYKLVRLLTI